ncbi:MAG: hypothetical protein IJZ40_01310 [Bacteroidaceae bacterium]|nr:hypothetical protein [Bacteroidaceae bacterium]
MNFMKISFYLATAIVALSWMGCSQEEATNEIMSGANVIQATIESSSRSAVTDAGVFSWTTGDEISLLDESNKDTYTYSGSGNNFTPPTPVKVTTSVVAYYPANENHTTTKFYLPVTYGNTDTEYVASTNAAMIATSPTEGNTYAFMHLGGVMRFNVKNVPVNADGFRFSVSGKKITGEFEVKSGITKTIATEDDPSSNNTVTIRFKKLTEAKDMTFYVPMPTGTYNDYTVGLFIDGDLSGHEHTSTNVTNTIARKTLLLMPTFTWNGTSLDKGEAIAGVIDLEDGSKEATIEDDAEVVVTPGTNADAVATLNYAPADNGSSALSISDGSGATQSGDSEGKVLVSTANGTTVASCDINTPSMTVELSAADNGTAIYNEVTALTAKQTLIIGENVTVKKLILKGGNVRIKGGTVTTIYDADDNEFILVKTLDELKTAISGDKNIILGADITSTEIITINRVLRLNGNGYKLINTSTSSSIRAINIEVEGEVIIKNLTVEAACQRAFNVINKPAKLTLESVTATAKNYAVMVATSAGAATLDIKNSDMTGANTINIAGAGTKATITNTNITSIDNNANEGYAAIALNNTADNAIVTVDGGKIALTGSYVDGSFAGYSTANGTSITINNVQGDNLEIKHGACYISYSNQTSYGFNSLADALTKVKNGETITLAEDVEISANTVVNAGVTIDGSTQKYTVNTTIEANDASTGIGKGVFNLAGGTIKNITFESKNTQYDIIVTAGGSVIEGCNFPTATIEAMGKGKRAIFTDSTIELSDDLTVKSCTFDDKVYAFNFSNANNKMDITFEGCTLGGWLSGHGKSHTFINCTFTESGDYANYIPYCPATFNGCTFNEGFAISLKKGSTYTFIGTCTYAGENITEPDNMNWDFSGGTTGTGDNGTSETVVIGDKTWTNSVGEGTEENKATPVWQECQE